MATTRRIDGATPGKSTADDCFYDPHGTFGAIGSGNHAGNSRDSGGGYVDNNASMPRGGVSSDGDDYVKKYKPGGRKAASSDVPRGSSLNDEGDGYASDNGGDDY
jgi:hypothetical protein